MGNLIEGIEEILLMGPGPSNVPQPVLDALGTTTIGHLDPYFIEIMDVIKEQLREVMKTENELTIPMSGTGSAGMETCFVNLVESGDPVLVLKNGVFGMRMEDVAERLGANVDTIEYDWGTPVKPDDVEEMVGKKDYKLVAVVHAETSTGVANPVDKIGALLDGSDSLYLVDTVTSLGGMDVRMDEWGVDVMYSGTQKCLSCPPGLSPVSFSSRALETLKSRKSKVPNWYLDLSMIVNYWSGRDRVYHHTAPINMLYGLYQALDLILAEGLENVFKRHAENHELLVSELEGAGLSMFVDREFRLPMLNAVTVPEGVDEAKARGKLRKEHMIEVGAGLGPLAGKIWRIGLMGHTSRKENVSRLMGALSEIL